jgi:MoxR-like ATPase
MHEALVRLRDNIARVYLGNPGAVDHVIRCLLSRGHLLLEDVPGVGKTVLATALARSVEGEFSRIQLTPDLLPSDILGVTIYNRDNHTFDFKRGPIFANIVLADEINRTPPRTQTALLEAMNEATVTIDGQMHRLAQPFMLIATQNPYDFEGTYPLPENQLDRFLMRISLGYPTRDDEARVLEQRPADHALTELSPVLRADEVVVLQREVDAVRLDRSLVDYIIDLARATRDADEVQVGLSPRGSLALAQAARATAFLDSRDYVIPEDILDNVAPVCAHRIITRPYASSNGHSAAFAGAGDGGAAMVLQRLLQTLPSPA